MLFHDRQYEILSILKDKNTATIGLLCSKTYASPATIRRDLATMEENNLLVRIRGGASLPPTSSNDQPHLLRSEINHEQKETIAKIALKHLPNGSTCFLDASTTVGTLAKLLSKKEGLTIITNGLDNINILGYENNFSVISTGGVFTNRASFLGSSAISSVDKYHVNICFFSCCGVSLDGIVTEAEEENAAIKHHMVVHSTKRILLCDSSKFNSLFLCVSANLNDIDLVITEKKPENYAELSKFVDIIWE